MEIKFEVGDVVTCVNSEGWEHSKIIKGHNYTIVDSVSEGENYELWIDYANEYPDDFKLYVATKHNHYFKDCPYEKVDVYRLLSVFEVTDPCLQHLVKKGLCAGKRGHKDFRKDLQDIIDTAQRRIDMLDEDEKIND